MEANYKLKKVADKQIIYDGDEDGFYDTLHTVTLDNGDFISFHTYDDFKYLKQVEKDIIKCEFQFIVKSCNLKKIRFGDTINYESEEGLIRFKEIKNYFLLISIMSEVTKGRYYVGIESVFEKISII